MNEQIDPAAKAAAARAREDAARSKARKNTIAFGVAMFGIVFALLSFKYVTGNDPSLKADPLAAQRQAEPSFSDGESDEWQGGGDDGWQQQPQIPQQQSLPQDQSGPPTTGAS